MSNAVSLVDPISAVLSGGDSGSASEPQAAQASADILEPKKEEPKNEEPKNERIEDRAGGFETRAQSLGQRAAAAGATRSGNEADLLGYTVPKRKGAARSILG